MKTLDSLKKDEIAIIEKIEATQELKYRFMSLGITKNSEIKVIEITGAKQTIQVEVNGTSIALRLSEAKMIRIKN